MDLKFKCLTYRIVSWLWTQLDEINVVKNCCWGKIHDHSCLMKRYLNYLGQSIIIFIFFHHHNTYWSTFEIPSLPTPLWAHRIVVLTIFNWTFNNHYYVCKPSKESMFHIKTNILYHFKLHFNWWFAFPFFYLSNFQLHFLVLWCTTNLLYYLVHWWTSITILSALFSCNL
jgi:hypothetical protein